MTNRHVAKLVARRSADGKVCSCASRRRSRYGAALDFKEEVGAVAARRDPVHGRGLAYLADDASPDVALLRIAGRGLPSPLPLADARRSPTTSSRSIGYPAFDYRNDTDDQATVLPRPLRREALRARPGDAGAGRA